MQREELRYMILNFTSCSRNIEQKIDFILNKYYNRRINFQPFLASKQRLCQLVIEEDFPTGKQWDKIAKKESYLSHISMEYIEGKNWREIEKNIKNKIKEELELIDKSDIENSEEK